jgi:hypothetical protein
MKKALSILFSIVFLGSGMNIYVAHHFCTERSPTVKISLTGEKASCGMDETDSPDSNCPVFDKRCCEDQVTSYILSNNYIPEFFELNKPVDKVHIILFQDYLSILSEPVTSSLQNTVFPPGKNLHARLTQPDICVFRI